MAGRGGEAASFGLAPGCARANGAGSGSVSRVGDGLDGGVVGGRSRGRARGGPLLSAVSAPTTPPRALASRVLGAAIGLLAAAPLDLALARRHAGAVETEVEGMRLAGLGAR